MSGEAAVLLPVRLETAFDEIDDGVWRLRVLVVPDPVSVDQHDPTVRGEELDAVDRLWAACGGELDTEAGRAAFGGLARAYGGGRAAWLVRTFPAVSGPAGPVADRGAAVQRTRPRGGVIRGLPREIELWAELTDGSRVRLDTLEVTSLALRVELDPEAEVGYDEMLFRPSWAAASGAGLTSDVVLSDFGHGPIGPADISVLYAVGVGDDDLSPLFAAHRDAGRLAITALGEATNTVTGAPAADLAADPEAWTRVAVAGVASHDAQPLSFVLTGNADTLGPLPQPPPPDGWEQVGLHAAGPAMVAALWPALWGMNLKDVWGVGTADPNLPHKLGLWAGANLRPEGLVPPVRIGDLPYGVLVATSLTAWDPSDDPSGVEAVLVPELLRTREAWADAGRSSGTIAGADSNRVLDLLERVPVSSGIDVSLHVPMEVAVVWGVSTLPAIGEMSSWWRSVAATAVEMRGGEPARRFVQLVDRLPVELPLVLPTPDDWLVEGDDDRRFQRLMNWLAEDGRLEHLPYSIYHDEVGDDPFPASVLARLVWLSLLTAAGEVWRESRGLSGPVTGREGLLQERVRPLPVGSTSSGTPAADVLVNAFSGAAGLGALHPDELDRMLRATIDTASHRIDPWITGLATRRLVGLPEEPRASGVYGWVDGPFDGARGPTEGGLLLAPSPAQARAAVILRDKAVHRQGGRWDMSLDSRSVRLADQIAQEVRLGAHLAEVLGRLVEQVWPQNVDTLRAEQPLRTGDAGRRVCDGVQVLARSNESLQTSASEDLTAEQGAALDELRAAVDTYGDLLVADAVFDVVSGRGETAGAAMDAAAGLELPPDLDVLRTQRAGRTVTTTVLAVLPAASAPPSTDRPVQRASPAVAAFLDAALPRADRLDVERAAAGDRHDRHAGRSRHETGGHDRPDAGPAPFPRAAERTGRGRDRRRGRLRAPRAGAAARRRARRAAREPRRPHRRRGGGPPERAARAATTARCWPTCARGTPRSGPPRRRCAAISPTPRARGAALARAARWGIVPTVPPGPRTRSGPGSGWRPRQSRNGSAASPTTGCWQRRPSRR